MVDFEQAFHLSISRTFGLSCKLMGCQFHFKQCIWRWLKKNLDESCRKSVLREADILCHQETRSSFENQYRIFQINLKSYPHFLDYFHKQWIVHFEPQCWATFGRIETFSFLKVDFWLNTSNKIEHWHGMIKSEKRSETFQSQKGYQLDQLIKFLFGVSEGFKRQLHFWYFEQIDGPYLQLPSLSRF